MNKRAEAFARYNDAAVLQMLIEVLPKVAHEVAAPMASIDRLTVISTDGAGQLPRQVTDNIVQTMALLKDTTGVDLESLLSGYLTRGRGIGESQRHAAHRPRPRQCRTRPARSDLAGRLRPGGQPGVDQRRGRLGRGRGGRSDRRRRRPGSRRCGLASSRGPCADRRGDTGPPRSAEQHQGRHRDRARRCRPTARAGWRSPRSRKSRSTWVLDSAHGANSTSGQVGLSARPFASCPSGSSANARHSATRSATMPRGCTRSAGSRQAGSSSTAPDTRSGRRAASAPAMPATHRVADHEHRPTVRGGDPRDASPRPRHTSASMGSAEASCAGGEPRRAAVAEQVHADDAVGPATSDARRPASSPRSRPARAGARSSGASGRPARTSGRRGRRRRGQAAYVTP